MMGFLDLFAALVWAVKSGKKAHPLAPYELRNVGDPTWTNVAPAPAASYAPTDQGIRIEQLKTLAALRDSGSLTEEEFEAKTRRLLERQLARATALYMVFRRVGVQTPRSRRWLVAAGHPLVVVHDLVADSGGVAVAGIDDGIAGQLAETARDGLEDCREVGV
jgi:hypothetical protein